MKRHALQHYRFLLIIVLLAGGTMILSGFLAEGAMAKTDPVGTYEHSWMPLTTLFSEEKGYGLYTYVLFGHQLNSGGGPEKEALERYESLLKAVRISTSSFGEAGKADKKKINLFLVPFAGDIEAPARHAYNDTISRRYLSFSGVLLKELAPAISDRLASGAGPFLITVPLPLQEMEKQGAVLLYADLSYMNPLAMAEIVEAYKRIFEKEMRTAERFGSLRLALREIIPAPDENVGIVVATRGDPSSVTRHLWKPLTSIHSEERDYGMYTYVLFGRRLRPRGRLRPETMERYESLLKAIHISTLSVAEVHKFDKAVTNILLIPLTVEANEPNRNNYNAVVSLRYISIFKSKIRAIAPETADRLTRGEGPFLITTLQALEDLESKQLVMLYADLSTTNPAAMGEIVLAYKQKVEKGVRQIERFRSLRLALLDFILDADDNLKIVQTALAGE